MPHYYFNVRDGKDHEDDEGMTLPGPQAACFEAVCLAGRIINDEANHVVKGEDWRLEVTDSYGLILFQIDFLLTEAPSVSGAKEGMPYDVAVPIGSWRLPALRSGNASLTIHVKARSKPACFLANKPQS